MNQSSELVQVYLAKGEAEAQIIKSLLESFDIPCMLKYVAAFSASIFVVDGVGQVSVMVREQDAIDAREILKGEQAQDV